MKAIVIGAGFIARQHIGAIQALDDIELAGVCDLSPGVAACVAERFGIARWRTDYRQLLDEVRPDVVHIATPVHSHLRIATDALDAGAHVLVEKPITATLEDWHALREHAARCGRWVLEDHNYQFNGPTRQIREAIESGKLGQVSHVDALYCLNIRGADSPFADPNLPHPCLSVPGGAIHDFLPHMAYLVYLLVGEHHRAEAIWLKQDAKTILPSDEFRGMIEADRGTATMGFSSHAEPAGFWLTVYATGGLARVNFFENRITIDSPAGGPLGYLRNGLGEGRSVRRAAIGSLWRKLSGGPGIYQGLYELVRRLYRAVAQGGEPPVSVEQIDAANRLVYDLTRQERRGRRA